MDEKKTLRLAIDGEGIITAIYSDDLVEAGLTGLGLTTTERAADVEPWPVDGGSRGWWVKIRGGSHIVRDDGQPFPLRSQALAAEVSYLNHKLFERRD